MAESPPTCARCGRSPLGYGILMLNGQRIYLCMDICLGPWNEYREAAEQVALAAFLETEPEIVP